MLSGFFDFCKICDRWVLEVARPGGLQDPQEFLLSQPKKGEAAVGLWPQSSQQWVWAHFQ